MRVLILGVGDAFSAAHYSTSAAVLAGERWLLIDCPHPIRKMHKEACAASGVDLSWEACEGVALTHLHADHASGLESLAYFFRFVLGRRLPLYTHPKVAARVWDGHLAAGMEALMPDAESAPRMMGFDDYFALHPLDVDGVVEAGPFAVRCRETIHHIPTVALRVRVGERELGWSADTAFDPELIAWLGEADRIVHETNYGVHTPYEDLAGLPEALRARMHLIHYPDDFAAQPGGIPCLREGDVLSLG